MVTLASACTTIQDGFCNFVDPESYVLVSIAGCQTLVVSVDYDADTDFPGLNPMTGCLQKITRRPIPVLATTPGFMIG